MKKRRHSVRRFTIFQLLQQSVSDRHRKTQRPKSKNPAVEKSAARQNQHAASFGFWCGSEIRQSGVGRANTFIAVTNPKSYQCRWFKSSGQGWLNKQHVRCHNGATWCASPSENKLASTLIPGPVSASLALPLLSGVLAKENISQ